MIPAVIKAIGQAVLVAGTVTVNTALIGPNDFIFLTVAKAGGTQGDLAVGTIVSGTSFVINSSNNADTSTVSWMIVEVGT